MSHKITAGTLGNGALLEAIDHCLEECLENIADPNTDPVKPRKVTATITIKVNENRNMGKIVYEAKSALVPAAAIDADIIIDRDKKTGKRVASELFSGEDPNQHNMLEDIDNVSAENGLSVAITTPDGKTIPLTRKSN